MSSGAGVPVREEEEEEGTGMSLAQTSVVLVVEGRERREEGHEKEASSTRGV